MASQATQAILVSTFACETAAMPGCVFQVTPVSVQVAVHRPIVSVTGDAPLADSCKSSNVALLIVAPAGSDERLKRASDLRSIARSPNATCTLEPVP